VALLPAETAGSRAAATSNRKAAQLDRAAEKTAATDNTFVVIPRAPSRPPCADRSLPGSEPKYCTLLVRWGPPDRNDGVWLCESVPNRRSSAMPIASSVVWPPAFGFTAAVLAVPIQILISSPSSNRPRTRKPPSVVTIARKPSHFTS
jgi:hypothetical protein